MSLTAITGANGNLGVKLIRHLEPDNVRAVVRSARARDDLLLQFPTLQVCIVDYTDPDALREAIDECGVVVHLVGILKEAANSSYEDAHERSCQALVKALPASVKNLVYLSIVGSHPAAGNACLASKGRAEQIILQAAATVCVLQVPMVLGEGDYAAAALRRNASGRFAFSFRTSSLEQPIYAGDVIHAIVKASHLSQSVSYQLGGPESLSRRALLQRAARCLDNRVSVISIPLFVGLLLAALLETGKNPPVTRAMLGVLDHDDEVSNDHAEKLGITLTPLDDMLSRVLKTQNT